MYMPNTFHNTLPSKATTVKAKSTATLIKVILVSRSTWSRLRSDASRIPTHSLTIVGRVCVPDPLCTPLPCQGKYGASRRLDRVRAVVFLMYLAMNLNTRPRSPLPSIWCVRIGHNGGPWHDGAPQSARPTARRKAREADERRREKRNQVRKRRSDDLMEAWHRYHPTEH